MTHQPKNKEEIELIEENLEKAMLSIDNLRIEIKKIKEMKNV